MASKEIIFVAKPTSWTEKIYPGYLRFCKEFHAKLKQYHKIEILDLPDIWVRDFLPVQNHKTGQLHQMFFAPRYANYTPKFTLNIRKAVQKYFPRVKSCRLRIDGGNIILNPECGTIFCFEKQTIFCKSKFWEKHKAEQCLKNALGAKRVVWLPHETGDKICHIDGYMQFLGNKLFISDEAPFCGKILWLKRQKALAPFIDIGNIVLLPCMADESDYLSAKGIYVNFLETSVAVFVPQYNLPYDKEIIKIMRKHISKPIIEIDCSQIAEYGGAVHCLTREYK